MAGLTPFEAWEHSCVEEVFHLTTQQKNAKSKGYTFLSEFQEGDKQHPEGGCLLTGKNMDAAFFECLQTQKDSAMYLYGCWQRIKEKLDAESTPTGEPRMVFLSECHRLCVQYLGLNAMNEMFENTLQEGQKLWYCLKDSESGASALVQTLLDTYTDAGELELLFLPVVKEMMNELKEFSIADGWTTIMKIFRLLASKEKIAKIIIASSMWIPTDANGKGGNGKALEDAPGSVLGSFFALSPAHPKARPLYLQLDPNGNIDSSHQTTFAELNNVRPSWHLLTSMLFQLSKENFLGPKHTRPGILQWFASVLNSNHERTKTQINYSVCSSDCFMLNVMHIILQLVEPIIAKDETMKTKVLARYTTSPSSKLDYEKYNRAAMTSADLKKIEGVPEEFSFVTESFFFAYHALHLGLLPATVHLEKIGREIREIKQALEDLDSAANTLAPILKDFQRKPLQEMLNRSLQLQFSLEAMIFDPPFVQRVLNFCNYASLWLQRVAFGSLAASFTEDLPDTVPQEFAALPEFFLDTISEVALFYMRQGPRYQATLHDLEVDHLLSMMVLFTPNSKFIVNPYIRSRFPEILFVISVIDREVSRAGMHVGISDVFLKHSVLVSKLIPALMILYVDMEHLGGHNQFYEKFTPRYYIAELFKYLWSKPIYKEAFAKEADANLGNRDRESDHFVKFFNYLLNDANYLLGESITCLKEINEYENLRSNPAEWNALDKAAQDEKTEQVEKTKRTCSGFMRLANESVNMMEYMSKDLPQTFLQPELIDQAAAMMNYFLEILAGKKVRELKVANATSYNFNHRTLIEQIVRTYLHFRNFPEFHAAVARDGRSYTPETFQQAVAFLKTKSILRDQVEIEHFAEMCTKFEKAYESIQEEEEIFGEDLPDEFTDPITCTIIHNPVKLPSSGTICDRDVIRRHLLNDELDPFNRAALTEATLNEYNKDPAVIEEMAKLKKDIDEWKLQKRKENEANQMKE